MNQNQTLSELKGNARENLIGNYALLIGTYIAMTFAISMFMQPFQIMLIFAAKTLNPVNFIIGIAGSIVLMIVSLLLSSGFLQMHLNIARREKASLSDMLYPFKYHPDKFIGAAVLFLLLNIVCLFPGFFICILGMTTSTTATIFSGLAIELIGVIIFAILSLGFAFTFYLLLDQPYDMTVIRAFQTSWALMYHKKAKLFLLGLSFIGWALLGLLSLGIANLWVSQYYEQSIALFYLNAIEPSSSYEEIV